MFFGYVFFRIESFPLKRSVRLRDKGSYADVDFYVFFVCPVFVKKTNAFTPNTLIIGKPFDLSAMPEFQGGLDHEKLDKAGAIISKEIYTLKRDYVNKKIRKVTNFYNLQIWDLYNQMYEKWSKAKLAKYDKISKPFIRAITHTQLKMTKKVFKLQKKYGVDNSQIIQAQTVTIA